MTAAHQTALRDHVLADTVANFCPVVFGASKAERSARINLEVKVRRYGNHFADRMKATLRSHPKKKPSRPWPQSPSGSSAGPRGSWRFW